MTSLRFRPNPLLTRIAPPPIPSAQAWKAGYSGALGPMTDLSQAVPGTPPPQAFLDRLGEAARQADMTRYGSIYGDLALREAHAAETTRIYGGGVSAAHTCITAGCNEAFMVAMLALAQAGEAILLPTPWYFNHKMALDMLGIEARPLPCQAEDGFIPSPERASDLIDGSVRAIVLVTPNNPTGAVYPPEVIAGFYRLAQQKGIALVLDETYRDFLPAGQARSHDLMTDPDWPQTLVQLYSFSKAHAIPGHRLGAMVAAPELIAEIAKILDTLQICPARPAQGVVSWAIEAQRGWREEQRRELARRAEVTRRVFAHANGWRIDSIGAYFAFIAHPFEGRSAAFAAETLARTGGVLGLPGSFFGPGFDTHLRIAFANVDAAALASLPERLRAVTA